jgi:hypothetical protein
MGEILKLPTAIVSQIQKLEPIDDRFACSAATTDV